MGRDYADPRFGVTKRLDFQASAAINGTVAATEIYRKTMFEAGTIKDWNIFCKVGGTEASVRKVLLAVSSAGTGALSYVGTQALGTQANGTVVDSSVVETDFEAGDDIVIGHLGTGAGVYEIAPSINYVERFVNA